MSKININIEKLIEAVHVHSDDSKEIESKIAESILHAIEMGAKLGAADENILQSKIEIIEKYHSGKSDKGIKKINKIERTIIWDGEEIYKEVTDPLRKSFSPLGNFMEWILFKRNPNGCANDCKVGKDVCKPFRALRKIFGK